MSRAIQSLLLALAVSTAVQAITDTDILNFALNLEYLEANFYSCAALGKPIDSSLMGSGAVMPTGCTMANLSPTARAYASAIARDEINHVKFLRAALGSAAVSQPAINIGTAFQVAANAAINATLIPPFSAYGDDVLFYHAAFIFEDVGVTAYLGAAPLISNVNYLGPAAGILAVEAYHGGAIRTLLATIAEQVVFPYGAPVQTIVGAISALRASVGGGNERPLVDSMGNYIVSPGDANAVAFARTPQQVLSIVTLAGPGNKGGFFPSGLNGNIKQINC